MAKTKWRCREYTPSANQSGSHSFYAEAVINSDLTNEDLASRIQARTGFKSYEVQAIIAAVAEVVAEEVLESNRVTLADSKGTKMVSIYPKVSGSVSDADILKETTEAHEADSKIAIRSVAEESDLTADRLVWTLGATMGVKYSKQFAHDKQAQKVKFVGTDTAIPNDDEPEEPGNTGGNTGGGDTPGGGGNGGGGNTGGGNDTE